MDNDDIDPDIPMRVRGVSRLQPGTYVTLSYTSPRIKNGFERSRNGEIESVETLSDGRPNFTFTDEHSGQEVEVTIGQTLGECEICSLGKRKTTLGTPLRIQVFEDDEGYNEAMLKGTEEHFEGRYPSYVAVAHIKWNEGILKWFNWTEENA